MTFQAYATGLALAFLAIGPAAGAPASPGPSAPASDPHPRAPWWMDQPIIASSGHVRAEVAANRASFTVTYRAVQPTAEAATQQVAGRLRSLALALAGYGADAVHLETSFSSQPLYEQYKEKSGALVDNSRADKITGYQVEGRLSVSVRDLRVIQKAYATALSTRPDAVGQVFFSLEPDNRTNTEMFRLAVADAAQRARLAAEAAGTRLGPVRLIDPTGRACDTDVLVAGAQRGFSDGLATREVEIPPQAAPPAPPPPPPPPSPESDRVMTAEELPVQPPMETLTARSCVIYALQ
jgi:uncharacterized protein